MSPFQAAVDAAFAHLGIEAVLEQDGKRQTVRVLPYEEDDHASFGEVRLKDRGGSFEIRGSEFEGFGKGAVLEVSGKRRKVQDWDVKDRMRLKKILRTVPL